jgi:threonine aldolase
VLEAGYVAAATDLAREHGLATHLDGARLFNAAVATGTPLAALCAPFDSVSLCFSKGLGAPVGSVLVGTPALIGEARRWRKVLGGGMRQAGVLAAACHHALDHHVAELAEDHRKAERLAEGLAGIDGVEVVSRATNMVFARFPEADREPLRAWLEARGILVELLYSTRFVAHRDVSHADIETVIQAIADYRLSR